jgi:Arc/MetJ-type ribon-helix-helix transcriptional regulator
MTRRRVREAAPLQVYLVADERDRLERLADQLDASKSDVVRRGLLALERELLSPASHPALRLIGMADAEIAGTTEADAARDHDQIIAEAEEASWNQRTPARTDTGKKRVAKTSRRKTGGR